MKLLQISEIGTGKISGWTGKTHGIRILDLSGYPDSQRGQITIEISQANWVIWWSLKHDLEFIKNAIIVRCYWCEPQNSHLLINKDQFAPFLWIFNEIVTYVYE